MAVYVCIFRKMHVHMYIILNRDQRNLYQTVFKVIKLINKVNMYNHLFNI